MSQTDKILFNYLVLPPDIQTKIQMFYLSYGSPSSHVITTEINKYPNILQEI